MEGRILFGKYEIGMLLGEGNFGKVYKGKNLSTREIVAIKMINKEEVKRQGMKEQVKKEISVMHLVKHPNIVELKEVMATKTYIYLVMEYVGGGDLYNKIIKTGKLDENLARKFFQQLITAVDFCHSRGVCHRDLKLENILLDQSGENLKICDFGLATMYSLHGKKENNNNNNKTDENVLLYTACGAFSYMAPEIIRGEKYDGKKCDIWSCGVILFILLAGYPPFQDENRMRLFWKIRVTKYEFPKEFPKEVEGLIRKILVKNPNERMTMSDIMMSPWFRRGLRGLLSYESDDLSLYYCVDNNSPESSSFNAFDFVASMASGLDLSGLFETSHVRKLGSLFVTRCSTQEVMSKVEEIKYEARKEKVSRGMLVVGVEVFEITPEVKVVEFSKRAGDSVEYLKMLEEVVRPVMKDVALKWQGDWVLRKNSKSLIETLFPKWRWC